jgi:hypothetical protein
MTAEEAFEPARRELCPDGGCIGLIGADGRCKVCGTVSPSAVADPRRQGMVATGGEDTTDEADDDRELCPDGACIGLIGADGKCNACGAVREAPPLHVWKTDGGADGPPELDGDGDGDEDEDSRELCPDGGCIGLIGPNGRCKVCGLARGSAAP